MFYRFKHSTAASKKGFLLSLVVCTILSSTCYIGQADTAIQPKITLVDYAAKDRKVVQYKKALQIAFAKQPTTYSTYQEHNDAKLVFVAYATYACDYTPSSQTGFYIHTTLDSEEDSSRALS